MTVVALTGGIAAGKSTVLEMFRRRGAVCIDADVVAREVVAPGMPALSEIAEEFGQRVIRDGELDRAALAEIVFSDEDARKRLNNIVHPRVQERSAQLFIDELAKDPRAVIMYAIPLLVETQGQIRFDRVIAVSASEKTRIQRLVVGRHMSESEARARVEAQASELERREVADDIISTEGTLEQTEAQVDAIWRELRPA